MESSEGDMSWLCVPPSSTSEGKHCRRQWATDAEGGLQPEEEAVEEETTASLDWEVASGEGTAEAARDEKEEDEAVEDKAAMTDES